MGDVMNWLTRDFGEMVGLLVMVAFAIVGIIEAWDLIMGLLR